MRSTLILLVAAGLAGCGQSGGQRAANQAAAAAPKQAKIPYCFFKDQDTRGWKASTDSAGNVVVKGQLYRSDSRYKAILGQPRAAGDSAEVWPTIVVNDTGYGAPDNWWPVRFLIPGSRAVDKVAVRCGGKVLATLQVPRKN